jgi:hypothetical protein
MAAVSDGQLMNLKPLVLKQLTLDQGQIWTTAGIHKVLISLDLPALRDGQPLVQQQLTLVHR